MNDLVSTPSSAHSDYYLYAKLAAAAVLWWIAYALVLPLSQWLTFEVLGLQPGTHLGEAVAFFLYDVPKILLLLTGMVFAIGIVRTFFSPERTRALLGGKRQGVGNVLAAMLGIVTPFCSCSAVPLFIGFVESGVPLGVTFSFLIAAPTINEVAIVLLYGLFGWSIAALYVASWHQRGHSCWHHHWPAAHGALRRGLRLDGAGRRQRPGRTHDLGRPHQPGVTERA